MKNIKISEAIKKIREVEASLINYAQIRGSNWNENDRKYMHEVVQNIINNWIEVLE